MSIDKKIFKYLGFLETGLGMTFKKQTFTSYLGFAGPIDTYSFYNEFGCITFHHIVQKGEWGWFTSKKFSSNQGNLLEKEIRQREYLNKSYYFTSSWLRDLQEALKNELYEYGTVFHIKVL